jgi:predicted DNA-binding transcriptional regulator AlpA
MAQIQFIQTSPEELKNDINSLVKVQLEDFLQKYQPQQPKEYLSRNDVSKMLGVNLSTLFNWHKKKILVPVGISGRVYYLRSEIEAKLIRLND